MLKSYCLDTSALLTFIQQEDGEIIVKKILEEAEQKKSVVYISFISLMETYYVIWKDKGENTAKELLVLIESLPIEQIHSTPRITLSAGRLKANHRLSVADAFIAATAIDTRSILVHKDPELKIIAKYTETLELPYKISRN